MVTAIFVAVVCTPLLTKHKSLLRLHQPKPEYRHVAGLVSNVASPDQTRLCIELHMRRLQDKPHGGDKDSF